MILAVTMQMFAGADVYRFCSTQFDLPPQAAKKVRYLADSIPSNVLSGDGRESHLHITVKWGLHSLDESMLRNILANESSIAATLGKTNYFSASDSSDGNDVVILEVHSPDLMRLNRLISANCENTTTFGQYKPHITLAYVKKGMGKKFIGDSTLLGTKVTFDNLSATQRDGSITRIPIGPSAVLGSAEEQSENRRIRKYRRREAQADDLGSYVKAKSMDIAKTIELHFGGRGSGCRGPNCGRPKSDAESIPKLPEGIEPYAGAKGLKSVHPETGLVAWTTDPDTSKLLPVKITGIVGMFDQHTTWGYKWLDGPDKGTEGHSYSRDYWVPEKSSINAEVGVPGAGNTGTGNMVEPQPKNHVPSLKKRKKVMTDEEEEALEEKVMPDAAKKRKKYRQERIGKATSLQVW